METVKEIQKPVYKSIFGARRGDSPLRYETRYVVIDEHGSVSWDCQTKESAQRFADARNTCNREEEFRLAEIAQHGRELTEEERALLSKAYSK
ncbi:MAG: hypothetical protein KGI54_14180 [Pseudomonadota bacterium]|nr:hypothetical protein [Pseudomonadota bacterium]